MLISASHMKDLTILASDGEIGSVEEFFFDDDTWTIRYAVVKAGSWLFERSVLISPIFVSEVNWEGKQLRLNLTKEQIEKSPDINTHQPVSRQVEMEYMNYYGSSYYWGGSSMWGMGSYPGELPMAAAPMQADGIASTRDPADSHLRSTTAVKGYYIGTTDGEIGHVQDFIVDAETWSIRYLEVATNNWLPGKKVLISPEHIESVDWLESKVMVDLPREVIRSAPEYIESQTMTREYENNLLDHYGGEPHLVRETRRSHA